jgi:lipopolysaccharide transport system permease protein
MDLLVGLALLVLLMPMLGVWPAPSLLAAPLVLLLLAVTVAALGTLLAGVTAVYRDVRFVVPFLVQVGMFITPVLWPVSLLAGPWKWLMLVNPVAGSLEAFRAAVLGTWNWETSLGLALAAGTTACLVAAALTTLARVEQELADVI